MIEKDERKYMCSKCNKKVDYKNKTSSWKECICGSTLEKNGILYKEVPIKFEKRND